MKKTQTKTALLATLALLLLTKESNAWIFGSSNKDKKFYITHSVPRERRHSTSAFKHTYFKILNGNSGIKIGQKIRIRLMGVTLRETRIKDIDFSLYLGFFKISSKKIDSEVSHLLIRKGKFDTVIEKELGKDVKSSGYSLKVRVVLKDPQGVIIADYKMYMKVTDYPQ